MSWIIVTPEEEKQAREAAEREFERWMREGDDKHKAREAIIADKCPHCGRHDPIPPWLY